MKTIPEIVRNHLHPRKIKAWELRQEGKTFREIAHELGRRSQFVSWYVREVDDHIEHCRSEVYALSVRAANCLNNNDLLSKKKARAALLSGRLHYSIPSYTEGFYRNRNMGKKTFDEICRWCELDPDEIEKICSEVKSKCSA